MNLNFWIFDYLPSESANQTEIIAVNRGTLGVASSWEFRCLSVPRIEALVVRDALNLDLDMGFSNVVIEYIWFDGYCSSNKCIGIVSQTHHWRYKVVAPNSRKWDFLVCALSCNRVANDLAHFSWSIDDCSVWIADCPSCFSILSLWTFVIW